MITVKKFTSKVRETIGTPFHHGGRVAGINGGLDCGGVILWTLQQLGYETKDQAHYKMADALDTMLLILDKNSFQKRSEGASPKPGDIILIRTTEIYHHLVYFVGEQTIIHAWYTTGVNKVVESTMLPDWWDNIHSIWRFKDLENESNIRI